MKKILRLIIILIVLIGVFVVLFKILKVQNIILKQVYPTTYSEYVEKYADKYNIDPLLIYSIIKAESNFNPDVKSSSNAIGVMQIMQNTAAEIAKNSGIELNSANDLYNPETNIEIGIAYFASLKEKYGRK